MHFRFNPRELPHMRMRYYPELITYAYVWCEICERTRPHTHTPTRPETYAIPHTDTHIQIQLLSHAHTHTPAHTHTHTHTHMDSALTLHSERAMTVLMTLSGRGRG